MNTKTATNIELHEAYRKIQRCVLEEKNVLSNLAQIESRISAAISDAAVLEAERNLALRNGSADSLELIEAELCAANGKADELKGRRAAIVSQRDSLRRAVSEAKLAAYGALERHVAAVKKRLADAIREDDGIQQLLADVFLAEACGMDAGVHPNGSSGCVRWESLIEEMFQPPSDHVIEAREPVFRKLHGIPLLADVSAGNE